MSQHQPQHQHQHLMISADEPLLFDCDSAVTENGGLTWRGDATENDLEALQDYTVITGNFETGSQSNITSLSLPRLQVVCGALVLFGNTKMNLTTITMRDLKMVGEGIDYSPTTTV